MLRPAEPFWWSLFSAGGVVAALLLPALMIVTGIAVPAGWISAAGLHALAQHGAVRILLFVVISLPLFHGAHRFRHILVDLGWKHSDRPLAIACYGTALVLTVLAGAVLFL